MLNSLDVSLVQFSHSVQVRLFVTPWTTACQASLSVTNSWSLPKLMSLELVMPFRCESGLKKLLTLREVCNVKGQNDTEIASELSWWRAGVIGQS